jgi:hypothetical protein
MLWVSAYDSMVRVPYSILSILESYINIRSDFQLISYSLEESTPDGAQYERFVVYFVDEQVKQPALIFEASGNGNTI